MAFVVTTKGVTMKLPPGKMTLGQMQQAVGGFIERVVCKVPTGLIAYVNEDGKLLRLAINKHATILANHAHDPFCGDVLFLSKEEDAGLNDHDHREN